MGFRMTKDPIKYTSKLDLILSTLNVELKQQIEGEIDLYIKTRLKSEITKVEDEARFYKRKYENLSMDLFGL